MSRSEPPGNENTPKKQSGKTPGRTVPRRSRGAPESFFARRRGATAPVSEGEAPEPVLEFETVDLDEDAKPAPEGESRERSVQRKRLQKDLEATPLARGLGLRLDYADNGVSRVRLPARAGNTEPGPLEGGVLGSMCVAAGHLAAASIAPGVSIRLVEYKLSILGIVQGDLLAIGEVVRKGRTLVVSRIEVVEDNDRVVAVGLATYLLQQA